MRAEPLRWSRAQAWSRLRRIPYRFPSRHPEEVPMAKCETCGNEYDRTFEVHIEGKTHTFDSFECAAYELAPRCAHCSVPILGHGVQKDDVMFCCNHCATATGVRELRDRA